MNTPTKLGNKEVTLRSTALTPVILKNIFKIDIMTTMQSLRHEHTEAEGNEAVEAVKKLGFVMVKQGEDIPVPDLFNLTEMDFFLWLDSFEYGELDTSEAMNAILAAWMGNTNTSVEAKNAQGAQ